ncbi:MAG: asparagine synthase B [Prevotella sp.]|nr:asparagine synthase B [Prevotella sp.]MBR6189516.1 asparagine synthase B [Prevotella sp.]
MCGIVAILNVKEQTHELREKALRMSQKIRHRGPDWSGIYCGGSAILAHERLSIVDPESGGQPLYSPDRKQVLAVNGEIYNHQEIRRRYAGQYEFQTGSDCEVILALYRSLTSSSSSNGEGFTHEQICHMLEQLSGIFAFTLYDEERNEYLIARDPIGVIPLYIGYDSDGTVYVASELKALEGQCERYEPFLPGHYVTSKDNTVHRYYKRDWFDYDAVKDNPASVEAIRDGLTAAVKRQLMSDVPYGVLLSGGLDSSVISALAEKFSEHRIEDDSKTRAYWPRLHSFAVGLKGAPDLAKAKMVADHIGTVHHEINYTIQEGLDAIRDVIYFIETYDVTTVRASTPMYLLARVIKSMGIKMVLSGEGADEIFGGYLYFHKAPNAQAFHEETVRKLGKLYLYDCLRANKSLSAWGVEGRVPFLDKEFLDIAMRTNPEAKMCGPKKSGISEQSGFEIEKKIVREAFANMLPAEVAWRQKEQFSDGVGYSWIDTLKQLTSEAVTDEQMAHAAERFPINPPKNKEEYYYRSIFAEHFPSDSAARSVPSEASVACSTAIALEWDAAFKGMNDPSGRAVKGVHEQAY